MNLWAAAGQGQCGPCLAEGAGSPLSPRAMALCQAAGASCSAGGQWEMGWMEGARQRGEEKLPAGKELPEEWGKNLIFLFACSSKSPETLA